MFDSVIGATLKCQVCGKWFDGLICMGEADDVCSTVCMLELAEWKNAYRTGGIWEGPPDDRPLDDKFFASRPRPF